jgi:hypothetical protein
VKSSPLRWLVIIAAIFVAAVVFYVATGREQSLPALAVIDREKPAAATAPTPLTATPSSAAAPTAVEPASPAGIPIFSRVGAPTGTKVDPRASSYRQVSSAAKPVGRAAVVDRAGMAALGSLKAGDTVSLPLMDGREVSGRVNLSQHDGRWVRLGGDLQDGNGTFFLSSDGSKVAGMILLKREKLAYELEEGKDGQLWMLEKLRSDVVCDPLPPEPGQALAPREGPQEAVPILDSRPGAKEVIYLDFDGETVTDPSWNGGNTIVAASFNLNNATINSIFDRVLEDWYPFNINLTTDVAKYNSAPVGHRMRVIITPTNTAAPGAGGVAYLTSFRNGGSSFSATIPCWVFNSSVIGISEAISHEVGHTMGLYHDGRTTPSEAYYLGHGSGATGWCPIMGAGYYKSVVQWSKGEYTAANNTEDDLAIISASYNHFGYMVDDAGNTRASANALSGNPTNGVISQVGLIERTGDIDYYTFFTNGGPVTINAVDPSSSPNLDIVLELQDAAGATIGAASNPPAALNATVSATLSQGQYYVKVSPTGAPTPPATGYTNYASLGQYVLSGTVQGLTQNPIVTSAATASGQVGVSFGYRIKASGNPNSFGVTGALPPGVVLDTATGYMVGFPTQAGTFPVVVSATNASGTGKRDVTITIADAALTLGEALDFPSLTWTTTAAAPWLGQKTVSFDGEDAAQSAVIGDGEETSFSTTVTGPVTLDFKWKVASEQDGDFLVLDVDGVEVDSVSGVVDWTAVSAPIDAGSHVITWTYRKNAAISEDPDAAWVDDVKFNSAAIPVVNSAATANGQVGVPFSYQITATNVPWSFALTSGTLPLGLTLDPETGVISGLPAAVKNANVTVTATNNVGPSTAFALAISISPSTISVAQALDDVSAGAYTTAAVPVAAAKWFPETAVTHDGVDAMNSGPIGPNEKTSISKTVSGFNTVNFWWKIEAKPPGNVVRFFVDGVEKASLSGIADWENVSVFIGPASHTLMWSFEKDASGSLGADSAWLDQVVLTTDLLPVITSADPSPGVEGTAFSYQIVATQSPTSYSATGLPAGLSVNGSGLVSGIPTESGNFSVVLGATNLAGTGTKTVPIVLAPAPVTLAESIEVADPPKLIWTTDSNFPWLPQTAFSFDNLHAARSGAVPQGGKSGIETHVTGPITVKFRWTVDSELNKDFLRFYIDGVFQSQISGPMSPAAGPANWELRTYTLGAGDHTLRWVYSKDPSTSVGRDAAWLDSLSLQPGSSLPVITSPLVATAYLGREFKYQITATNVPTSYAASPLPANLTVNPTTGLISGTPQAAGVTTVSISGDNSNGAGTAAALVLTVLPEPAGADSFANATALGGAAISVEGTNAFATAESGEPAHAGRAAKASLWYSWVAPVTGAVNVTTAGSTVDTLLSVYEGTALNNLVVVKESDDVGKLVSSAVKFNAVSGRTYYFAVDSLNGATGKIVLNVMYAATGVYTGLLKDPNGVAVPGRAIISLTPKFGFTGSLQFGLNKTGMKGAFGGEDFSGSVPRKNGATPLDVDLHVDLAPGAEEITGKVVADGVTYNLFAKLAVNKSDVPPELPGLFTFVIEPDDTTTAGLPQGFGYGSVKIDKSGKVKAAGVLGDGTKFTTGTTVAIDNSWVLYLIPYKAGGVCAGEVLVELLDVGGVIHPRLGATVDWARANDAAAKLFPNGFPATTARLKGYGYTPPGKDINVFSLTAPVSAVESKFAASDLAPLPTTFTATIDGKNKLTNLPAGFKCTFATSTGLFAGSFADPAGGKPHIFGGAVLNGVEFISDNNGTVTQQVVNRGAGTFVGTQSTGTVELTPP